MLSSPWLPRDHKGFQRGNGESGYHRKGPKLYSLKLLPRTCPYLLLFSLTTLHPFCFFIPYPVNSRPGSDGWYSNYRHILSYSQCDNTLLALLPGATASLRMNQTPTSLTQYFVLLGAFFFFFGLKLDWKGQTIWDWVCPSIWIWWTFVKYWLEKCCDF